MATLLELRTLFDDSDLMNKTEAAIIIKAQDLLAGTPTAADKAWANVALNAPLGEAVKAWRYVLAANNGLSVSAIQAASDNAIQTQVDAAVPHLVDALAGA